MKDKCPYSTGFQLKDQQPPSSTSFSADEEFVLKWLAELPMANPTACAEAIRAAVAEVNGLQINDKARQRFLDAIGDASLPIYSALRASYIQAPHPLPPRAEKARALLQRLHTEIVKGYQHLIFEYCHKSGLSLGRKGHLRMVVHAAFRYMGLIALESYHCRSPLPGNYWSDIHRLYAIAERDGLLDYMGKEVENESLATSAQAYKRMVLFELASPYTLDTRHMDEIYDLLPRLSDLVRISKAATTNADNVQILLDLLSDDPPFYPKTRPKPGADSAHEFRFLHTDQLTSLLDQTLQEGGDLRGFKLPAAVIDTLRLAWEGPMERSNQRVFKQMSVQTVVGMPSVYHYLEEQLQNPAIDTDSMKFRSMIGPSEEDANFSAEMSDMIVMSRTIGSWAKGDSNKRDENMAGAVTRDFSERGLRLEWQTDHTVPINVGDLMALGLSDGASTPTKLGRICWIKQTDQGATQAGIQLVAPYGVPMLSQICDSDGFAEDRYDVILIPGAFFDTRDDVLVCPGLPFRIGRLVRLPRKRVRTYVRLTKQVIHTRHFTGYLFESVDPETLPAVIESNERSNIDWDEEQRKARAKADKAKEDEHDAMMDHIPRDW
jgi:hypothetical protein